MVKESGQSAELNTDHGDINPRLGAGGRAFIIAYQAAMVHQPAEGAFDQPAPRQDFKALNIIGAFDHFDFQLGAQRFNPVSEGVPGVTAIDPQEAQPRKPAQHPAQDRLAAVALGGEMCIRDSNNVVPLTVKLAPLRLVVNSPMFPE